MPVCAWCLPTPESPSAWCAAEKGGSSLLILHLPRQQISVASVDYLLPPRRKRASFTLALLSVQMAQKDADAGYELPARLTEHDVYRIFGYSTPEEVEQFLQNCPRHYLRVFRPKLVPHSSEVPPQGGPKRVTL